MSDSIVVNVLSPEVTNINVNDTGENIYINPLTLNQGIINHSVTHQSGGSDELLHNLLGGLQGGSGGSYYHLTSGEYANLVTGVVVRPSDTGAFLTIGSADPRYVNITGQEVISGIKTFANGIYSPIISGASLTGTSITVDSDAFIMNCDLDMNNHSIKNVSTNSISFFNSGSGVADAIMSLGSEVYDGSLHDYIFSFDKNLKVQDRVIAKQGDQGITISNVVNAADNSEYLGSADILLPYSDEFLFIPEFNEVNRIPSNGTLISFGQDNLFSHKVTDVANSFYQNTSGKIIKIIPSIKPEEIKYLYDNGANGTTETVRSVEVYQVGQNQACLVYGLNLENGGLIFSENLPSIQTAKLSVDSTVVRTSGDQTISGFKTFANRPNVNGTGVLLSGEIIVPNTGELTGVFYPLNSNPNGYVTGDVVRPNETGNFIAFTALTGDRGDITVTGNSPSNLNFSIDSFAITSGKIADSAVTTAKIANFNVTTDKLGSLAVTTNIIATNAVTNTKLADMASQRIKGRISAGTSDPEDLTASQVRTLINFDDTVSGLLSGYVTGSVVRPSETGSFITNSQTGAFYAASNPSGFITGVDLSAYVTGDVVRPNETGGFVTTSQTGAFYATSNPSGFITGVDLSFSGNYYTKGESESRYVNTTGTETILGDKTFHDRVYINNLYVTGLETVVNTTNTNVASNFIMLNLTGGAVDGGLFFVTGAGLTGINDSGAILGFDHSDKFKFGIGTRASDLSVLDTIASVEEMTGISGNLQTQISSLSNATGSYVLNSQTGAFYAASNPSGFITGVDLSTYATITNLAATGSTLQTNINNLSGVYSTISNLNSTGSSLDSKINLLSGSSVLLYGDQTISGIKSFATGVNISGNLTVDTNTLFVDSVNNRVGIGTISPTAGYALDVVGAAKISGNILCGGYILYLNSQQSLTQGTNSLTLGAATYFTTINYGNASTTIHNFAAGNVGIGTTSPSAKLHTIATTEQVRFGYDTNNYWNATTNSVGITTLSAVGSGAKFVISSNVDLENRLSIIKQGIDFDYVTKPIAPTLALAGLAGNVPVGTNYYYITYVTADGETEFGNSANITVASAANAQVNVTLPVSSDPKVIERKIYRGTSTAVAGFLATVSDNTTTLYVDNTATVTSNLLYRTRFVGNTTAGNIFADGTKNIEIDSTGALKLASQYNSLRLSKREVATGTAQAQVVVYNTTDEENNVEYGGLNWINNVFEVGTFGRGAGASRKLRLKSSNLSVALNFDLERGGTDWASIIDSGTSLGNTSFVRYNPTTWTASGGENRLLTLGTVALNNTGSGGYSLFNIDATGGTGGTGSKFFTRYTLGGSLIHTIDYQGNGYFAGNVGIGTTSPTEKLTVAGNISVTGNISATGHFSAATKSFKIPHQSKGGHLQYGVVESDCHSVLVRGKISSDTITLPEHWSWLVDADSVTVQLTPVGCYQQLYIVSSDNQTVKVGGVTGEYCYVVYGTRKDVAPLEVEIE